MGRIAKRVVIFFVAVAVRIVPSAGTAKAQAGVTTHKGTLKDGATYLIEVPANWNGTLFLYGHGYVVPGASNPAKNVGDPFRYLRPFDSLTGD